MANECATTNCEDKSDKEDFAYCGKSNCASCGGGCGDDDCSKCNRISKRASNDRAFLTGWSVVKGKLQCNGREHIQLVRDERGNLKTDCECDQGCLPTRMTRS